MNRRTWLRLLVLAALVATGVVAWLSACGLFVRVTVTEEPSGPYALLSRTVRGPYRQTGAVAREVTAAAAAAGIEPVCGFGVFYDNPRTVKAADLRSDVGVVVNAVDVHRLGALRKTYAFRTFKRQPCLVATFPFRGTASVYLGIIKAYPALAAAARARGIAPGPALELYRRGESITYLVPLAGASAL